MITQGDGGLRYVRSSARRPQLQISTSSVDATPRHLLDKPGQLTADEMDVVRRHFAIGHAMVVEPGGLDPWILDIVLHHHEYLDGSGYPDGLRGEAISHLVRLTTICDICAAMIERRSYKPARSMADAVAALRGMDGRLDAALVRAFANLAHSGSSLETLDRPWTDPIRPTRATAPNSNHRVESPEMPDFSDPETDRGRHDVEAGHRIDALSNDHDVLTRHSEWSYDV